MLHCPAFQTTVLGPLVAADWGSWGTGGGLRLSLSPEQRAHDHVQRRRVRTASGDHRKGRDLIFYNNLSKTSTGSVSLVFTFYGSQNLEKLML